MMWRVVVDRPLKNTLETYPVASLEEAAKLVYRHYRCRGGLAKLSWPLDSQERIWEGLRAKDLRVLEEFNYTSIDGTAVYVQFQTPDGRWLHWDEATEGQ
jgi:hypothetical protein